MMVATQGTLVYSQFLAEIGQFIRARMEDSVLIVFSHNCLRNIFYFLCIPRTMKSGMGNRTTEMGTVLKHHHVFLV